VREHGVEELAEDVQDKLTRLYGSPRGRFLSGPHGSTHFVVEEPTTEHGSKLKVAVLSHGIGASLAAWDGDGDGASESVVGALRASGHTVVRYDFLGHGWSVAKSRWLRQDSEVFLSQLQDVLDHVFSSSTATGQVPCLEVETFVGHSTGGLVGILACERLRDRFPIRNLVLVAPALWKQAPLIVRISDQIPDTMWSLASGPLRELHLPGSAYLENTDAAFGKNEEGSYMYPDKHRQSVAATQKMLALHPQVEAALLGVANFFLVESNLQICRQAFASLAARATHPHHILLMWGSLDVVVPYKAHHAEALAMAPPGRVCLHTLQGLGHEAIIESPTAVVQGLSAFLRELQLGDAGVAAARTADVLKAWREGRVGKRQAAALLLKRFRSKLLGAGTQRVGGG